MDGKHADEFLDISNNTQTKSGGLNINGKIGIGTESPQVSLHNNGNFITKGPWVDVRAYASFSAAIDAIGCTDKTLLLPNEQVVSVNITVPYNVTLWFLQGGKLYIAPMVIVTINGHVEAGMYQIFNGRGTVWFGSAQKEVYPEWWGAYNNGTNANSTTIAIQAALDTSKPLQFTSGTYLVDASLNATSRNILIIKGAGKDKTIIKGGEAGYPILDCIGSLWIDISDIAFQTDCETNIASCGVLIGRKIGDRSAGNHRFSNVKFIGCYTISGVYSLSSEVNYFERCKFADSGAIPSTRMIGYVSSNDPLFLSPASKFETLGTGIGGNTVTTFVNPVFNMFSMHPDSRAMLLKTVSQFSIFNSSIYTNGAIAQVELQDGTVNFNWIGGRNEKGDVLPYSLYFSTADLFSKIRLEGLRMYEVYGVNGAILNDMTMHNISSGNITLLDVDTLIYSDIDCAQFNITVRSAAYENIFKNILVEGYLGIALSETGNIKHYNNNSVGGETVAYVKISNLVKNIVSIDYTGSEYILLDNIDMVLADATNGAIIIKLPASANRKGAIKTFKKIDSSENHVIADPILAETIDGDLVKCLTD